ncbi:MAG: ATP-binding protein [Candidatus Krumholzibacteria bacterium]|nr:ATP-binding protein [Candidatus Krumholzibacteria bacterium]
MKSPLRYLSARLFLLLLGVMLVTFSIHTYINIRTTSSNLIDYVYTSADRASDLIVRSTRYSMLLNRKEDVHQTINTVGSEPGFVGINIYNKNGEVIFSTDSLTIGRRVDVDAEACNICHASGSPLVSVPAESRMRLYESPDQGHVLGLINPIRNEPECSTAACHAHTPDQKVLGVLDVKMSLASVDQQVASATDAMIVSALFMTLVIAGVSGMFIYKVIRKPIKKLKDGMATISAGNLDAKLDIRSDNEISDLAKSFNKMASDLKMARDELSGWARTLEDRIAQKTEELQLAQSQVIHMEKMASVGKLSASAAHEINNPLFGILMHAKLVLRELSDDHIDEESLKKHLVVIQQESSRCGEIVKNLLDFARHTGGEFGRHHLNSVVEQVLFLLAHHFEMQQISVTTELMQNDDELVCDARQLQQAIIAPCINAVEAMPDGGSLAIETNGDETSVSIKVSDTGMGIPQDLLPRVFEPFFTTKEGEAGLGLGLSVVYGIVQRHRGKVEVDSEPGKGTTLVITLPREPDLHGQTQDTAIRGQHTAT